ncbi:MAG: DNA (cytosine-5-)-methyltransferase [Planctomycetota bacterium]
MRGLRFASVCAGIEAATIAWSASAIGWSPAWYSEIDPFACAVLEQRHGSVCNLGDMTAIDGKAATDEHGSIDLLVGGTPCQSFSVAGLRKGMADPRGNLALVFCRLVDAARPEWVVWENVPGVLSSGGGRDFGAFLGALGELGYGWAYRVLDAQYFGLAQRRKRVFVVARLGDQAGAAAVLFERACLQRDPPPSRSAGSGVAGTLGRGAAGSGWRDDLDRAGAFVVSNAQANAKLTRGYTPTLTCTHDGSPIVFDPTQITSKANRSSAEPGGPAPTLARGAHAPVVALNHRQDPCASDDVFHTLNADTDDPGAVCIDHYNQSTNGDLSHTLAGIRAGTRLPAVSDGVVVRRLTPIECERLMGFADDYTRIEWRGKPPSACPDSHRYRCLGNSIAVPVLRWIGRRIEMVR